MNKQVLQQALRRAYQLGQTYWEQADSESWKKNIKADETQKKFDALVVETCDALAQQVERMDAEIAALREDAERNRIYAECFQFWVHEAWNSPGDICRILSKCETKQDYINVIVPIIEARRVAVDSARSKQ